jgi:metal-sulfur cluster biosynthetic enzyme
VSEPEPTTPAAQTADAERPTSEQIRDALSAVYDPEIGIDIINLGLVYDQAVDDAGLLTIDMTLTSPYCPFGSIIQSQADAVCRCCRGSTTCASTWSGRRPGIPAPWRARRPSWIWASSDALYPVTKLAGTGFWPRALRQTAA